MPDGYACHRCGWGGQKPAFDGSTPICPDCEDRGTRSLLIAVGESGP